MKCCETGPTVYRPYPNPSSGSGIIDLLKTQKNIAGFALQEQPEDKLMVATSRAWCNGSFSMAAKPIIFLESEYTMIQFSITRFVLRKTTTTDRGTG